HIGFTGIHRINWKLRMGGTGTVIGEKSAWRKGFGSDAMRVRTKFAFETLGLHRLESEARIDNVGSQRALEKSGYRREGVARKKMFWGGQWYDAVLYGMLDEDYFTGRRSCVSSHFSCVGFPVDAIDAYLALAPRAAAVGTRLPVQEGSPL